MSNYEKIYEIIDKEKDFLINLTQEVVKIPSVNPKLEKNNGDTIIPEIVADENYTTIHALHLYKEILATLFLHLH